MESGFSRGETGHDQKKEERISWIQHFLELEEESWTCELSAIISIELFIQNSTLISERLLQILLDSFIKDQV